MVATGGSAEEEGDDEFGDGDVAIKSTSSFMLYRYHRQVPCSNITKNSQTSSITIITITKIHQQQNPKSLILNMASIKILNFFNPLSSSTVKLKIINQDSIFISKTQIKKIIKLPKPSVQPNKKLI